MKIVVEGRPVPQGSMVASYNRTTQRASVHHVQGEALALWRATIRQEAKGSGAILSPGPMRLRISFGMPRPKAHLILKGGKYTVKPQHYYDRPANAPDLDKLIRAVSDALTGVCYRDDAQIVEIVASKVYGNATEIQVEELETPFQTLASRLGSDQESSA